MTVSVAAFALTVGALLYCAYQLGRIYLNERTLLVLIPGDEQYLSRESRSRVRRILAGFAAFAIGGLLDAYVS